MSDDHSSTGSHSMQENASHMAENAKQQAKGWASEASEKGKSALNQRKDSVAQQVESVSGAMRTAADRLQQDGQSQSGYYVGMLADQIESLGNQLRNKDVNGLIRDVENFSRRAPMAFFAGALAAGFVAARFMKSSAERASGADGYDDRRDGDRRGMSGMGDGMHTDNMSYSWRNEMGEEERGENIGSNRTYPLGKEERSRMSEDVELGGQWGAGTNVAGPEITGIYRPSQAGTNPPIGKSSAPGVELPGSAQPAVAADGKPQSGRPTDPIGGSTKSTSPTDSKSGGNTYGKR